MASASDGQCYSDPNFAVICNFLDRYGELLGFKDISYADLQTWIEDTKHVSSFLTDMHVRLMRRMGKKITADRWEKYIMKFIHDNYSEVDAWEIDRYGYKQSKVSTKLTLLKTLMEKQFDLNKTFKEKINERSPEELRYLPLGRDKNGLAYWYMLDKELNLRVYREDLDDINSETWELVCSNRQELQNLITRLEGRTDGKEEKDASSEASGSVKNEPVEGAVKGEVSEESQDLVLTPKVEVKGELDDQSQPTEDVKKEPDKSKEDLDEVDGVEDKVKDGVSSSNVIKCEAKEDSEVKIELKKEVKEELDDKDNADVPFQADLEKSEKNIVLNEIKAVDIKKENSLKKETNVKEEKILEENKFSKDSDLTVEEKDLQVKISSKNDENLSDKCTESSSPKASMELAGSKSLEENKLQNSEDNLKHDESESDLKDDNKNSETDKNASRSHNEKCSEEHITKDSVEDLSLVNEEKCVEKVLQKKDRIDEKLSEIQELKDSTHSEGKHSNNLKNDQEGIEKVSEKCSEKENTDSSKASKVSELSTSKLSSDDDSSKDVSAEKEISKCETESQRKSINEVKDKGVKNDSSNIPGNSKCTTDCGDQLAKSGDPSNIKEDTSCESHKVSEKHRNENQERNEKNSGQESEKESIERTEKSCESLQGKSANDQSVDLECKKIKKHETKTEVKTNCEKISENSDVQGSKEELTSEQIDNQKNNSEESGIAQNELRQNENPNESVNHVQDSLSNNDKLENDKGGHSDVTNLNNIAEKKAESTPSANKPTSKVTNKNKNVRKRGIQYDETSEDSIAEPENKKAKDGKKMLPKGKRKTPSKVEALSSDDSDDVPLSQVSRGRSSVKSKSRKRGDTDSSQSVVTPTRKSSRPLKKKKLHSDEEYEDDYLTLTSTNSNLKSKTKAPTSDEGSPVPLKSKKQSKNTKKGKPKPRETPNKTVMKTKKKQKMHNDGSDSEYNSKNKKSKKVKSSVVESSEDEPLVKSTKNPKSKKKVETDHEKENIVDDGRRRSARVRSLQKQQKKEPTPEFSSLEEDDAVESDFKLTSEVETDDSDDVDFSPKGRNALRQAAINKQEEQQMVNNDTPCCKCLKYDRPDWLLLCDTCDAGYHTACLRPPLFIIPEGDWFCPPCEHKQLVTKLQDNLKDLDVLLKKHDRLIKRKERLAFVGISLDNILKEERKENIEPVEYDQYEDSYESESEISEGSDGSYRRHRRRKQYRQSKHHRSNYKDKHQSGGNAIYAKRTCRQRNTISYKFEDFDEMINSAIKEEVEEVKVHKAEFKRTNYGRNRGKDMANIYEAEGREYHPSEEEKEEEGKPPPVVNKKKKIRKLTLLDSDEEPPDDDSEEFHISEESCSEPPEEEEEDDDDDISDYSADGEGWRSSRYKSTRRSGRRRTGGSRFKDFVVDDEYDSDDIRRSRRKAARRRVNYDDLLNDEDETEIEEETEESLDSSDLCSDDSDKKKKHKKSKRSKKEKKKEKSKKKSRRIKSEEESDEENDDDKDDDSKTDDSMKSEEVKRSRKRHREKEIKKKKRRKSLSDSESDSDVGRRRSRRFAEKVNYKALLDDSDTDNEISIKSKKKKKESSTESESETESEESSSDEEKPPAKKKGAILDDTTDEEEEDEEKKTEEIPQEKVDQDQTNKETESNKISECEDKTTDQPVIDEQSVEEINKDNKLENVDQTEHYDIGSESVKTEQDGDQSNSSIEVQERDSGLSVGPQPIARPFPQYSDAHFPHQNITRPGFMPMQGMPYGPPHLQRFHPQQPSYPPNSSHNFPPNPQGNPPPQYPHKYPQMPNHPGHMASPPGIRSPPHGGQGMSSQGNMASPPHPQVSSPPHHMSSPPPQSQGQMGSGQGMSRPGLMQSHPGMGQTRYPGNYPSQHGPGNYPGYPPQMQGHPGSQQGPNMGPMGPLNPRMSMMGQSPPQSMMNRHSMPAQMNYHNTQGMRPQGRPDQMRFPGNPSVPVNSPMPMGYQSPEHRINRGQMNMHSQMSAQSSSGVAQGQFSGPLTSLGQMIPPGAQSQSETATVTNTPPSQPSMSSMGPCSSPPNGTSKSASKRGRPKGSKTKKRKGEPIDSPKSDNGSKEKIPVTGHSVPSQSMSHPPPLEQHIGSFQRPHFPHQSPPPMGMQPMHMPSRPSMPPRPPMPSGPVSMSSPMRGPPNLIPDSQAQSQGMGSGPSFHSSRFEPYNMNGGPLPSINSPPGSGNHMPPNHMGGMSGAGVAPGGGGRGFMIDNLLLKPQKPVIPEDYPSPSDEPTPGDQSEDSQETRYTYVGDEEAGEMSDIADIVKCFKA